jgi:hypothetical protein
MAGDGSVRSDETEHDGMAWTHRNPVHGDLAQVGQHGRGVIVAACTRPGDDEHEIGLSSRCPDRRRERATVVPRDREADRRAPRFANHRVQYQGVRVQDLAVSDLGAERAHLVSGRQDGDAWPPPNGECEMPGACGHSDVHGPQFVLARQQQFTGHDVLADGTHMAQRLDRGDEFDRPVGQMRDVLAHHDGVVSSGQGVAGVDRGERFGGQPDGGHRSRLGEVRSSYGDPVHRCQIVSGRGPPRPDRCRRHPPDRLGDQDLLGLQPRSPTSGPAAAHPPAVGLRYR